MGPLREGPPSGPNQYMRIHASITESLLSQGLGGYNAHYSFVYKRKCVFVCVCACVCVCVCVCLDTCCLMAAGTICFWFFLPRKRLSLISLVIREKACDCIFIRFDASLALFLSQIRIQQHSCTHLKRPASSVHSTPGSAQRATAEPASSKKLQFSH